MDISELIFNGTLGNIVLGKSSDGLSQLEIITEQDGDIPSIKHLYYGHLFFEIITLNEIILGIQLDFSYDENDKVFIKTATSQLVLNNKVSSKELISFLSENNIDFQTFESDTEAFSVSLKSKSTFYFDNHSLLFKLSVFDKQLYLELAETNKNKPQISQICYPLLLMI